MSTITSCNYCIYKRYKATVPSNRLRTIPDKPDSQFPNGVTVEVKNNAGEWEFRAWFMALPSYCHC